MCGEVKLEVSIEGLLFAGCFHPVSSKTHPTTVPEDGYAKERRVRENMRARSDEAR